MNPVRSNCEKSGKFLTSDGAKSSFPARENSYYHDTIAAPVTAWGNVGVGIIRVSGPSAVSILKKIFRVRKVRKKIQKPLRRSLLYGFIEDGGETVDEVLVFLMPKPGSYTREDVVEISSHGGPVVIKKILEIILKNGARMATPGEFTKRAFLNGRIDLVQAEAVADIINAKSEKAAKLSAFQLEGKLSGVLDKIRKALVAVAAALNAACDFPEDDIALEIKNVRKDLSKSADEVKMLLDGFENGKLYRDGVKVVITGKTNVGKSTLLNTLLGQDRAIVTPIPGTTRDIISETVDLKGIPAEIYDTAGIRKKAEGIIEKIGMQKSMESFKDADLIIFVFDASKKLDSRDFNIINLLKNYRENVISAGNKIDIRKVKPDKEFFRNVRYISCLTGLGIKELKNSIYEFLTSGKSFNAADTLLTNARHAEILNSVFIDIADSLAKLKKTPDESAYLVEEALGGLDRITGASFREDVIDEIFSKFCIGK